jgi:hypothetical protein
MKLERPKVLALDLEGTLISNAMSQIPRPGLFDFLRRCQELFPRVVMFTTVKEPRFRDIAALLVKEGAAPDWFADIEYVTWHGETKDLNFVPRADPSEVILVDDFEKYVHPGQESRWLQIDYFDYPYEASDEGLAKMQGRLEQLSKEA